MVQFDTTQTIPRRATPAPSPKAKAEQKTHDKDDETLEDKLKKATKRRSTGVPEYEAKLNWWQKPSIQYAFVKMREVLEKLMNTNLVSALDRKYIEKLTFRIFEDYWEMLLKRIHDRENEEYERVKRLVLSAKIPFENAPEQMAGHILLLLETIATELIDKRKAKIKTRKPRILKNLYWDDTPDPPSGLSIERGHVFRSSDAKLCTCLKENLNEDEDDEYMLTPSKYRSLAYSTDLIKTLYKLQNMLEIYDLGDEILGKELPEMLMESEAAKEGDDELNKRNTINFKE